MCVKLAEELKEEFIKKYTSTLDPFVFRKIMGEIIRAIQYMQGRSSGEHEPDKEIFELMKERKIEVCLGERTYDYTEIVWNGRVSTCLREDYEQGVNEDGKIYMTYSCSCDCGFNKEANYAETKHKIVEEGK